jgi:hypothetical protein
MYEQTLPPQKAGSRKEAVQSRKETSPEISPQDQGQRQTQHQPVAYQHGYGQPQVHGYYSPEQPQTQYERSQSIQGFTQPFDSRQFFAPAVQPQQTSAAQPLSDYGDIEHKHSESPYINHPSHGW